MYGSSSIPKHIDLTDEDVDGIMLAAWRRWAVGPTRLLLTAFAVVAAIGVLMVVDHLLRGYFGQVPRGVNTVVNVLWWFGLLAATEYAVRRFSFPPCLFAELRDRGHDLCIRCGYDLAALPGDEITCPECGRAGHHRPPGGASGPQPGA